MILRLEEPGDYREVENLTRDAFWNVYRPGCSEHLVVHNLRNDACFVPDLSYVIEENGAIIAHIAYAKGTLRTDEGESREMLLFGPVSVAPERQGQGYGDLIIRFTLERAEDSGYPAVVITGSPEYYHRFGFESASKHGVFYDGMDRAEEFPFFMINILDDTAVANLHGTYSDPACYFVSDEDVERFDQSFPPKKKEKLPGQLEF